MGKSEGECRERCVDRVGGLIEGVATPSDGKVLNRNSLGFDAEVVLRCPHRFRVDQTPQDRELVRACGPE